jgi:hypothetical protein
VHDDLLRRAAEILRGATMSRKLADAEAWLTDYKDYRNAPPGVEYVWMPETSPRWVLLDQPTPGYACRGGRPAHRQCDGVPVAKLNRANQHSPREFWFYYCPDHLYGRRIVDGVLQVRKLTTVTRTP